MCLFVPMVLRYVEMVTHDITTHEVDVLRRRHRHPDDGHRCLSA